MTRARTARHFSRETGPEPLVLRIKRRVRFRDVDMMGYVWFGNYAAYIEEASTELLRSCGVTYDEYILALTMAPMVQVHVDYRRPLRLDEEITIAASLVWCEAARLNIEYEFRGEQDQLMATAWTVQMFVDAETEEPCFAPPEILMQLRERWKNGSLSDLQEHRS